MQAIQVSRPLLFVHELTQEQKALLKDRLPPDLYERAVTENAVLSAQMRMKQDEIYAGIERARTRAKKGNDYQLLGLANHTGNLTRKIVQTAYRKQAQKCHPDKGGNPRQFQKLNAAYQRVLSTLPKE